MKSYGNLFDKILDMENLLFAMQKAAKGKRDRYQVNSFIKNHNAELLSIQYDLSEGIYQLGRYAQFKIMDPKPRLISCAPFRDRVVHHAVCNVIAPVLEKQFMSCSYACRKGMGMHNAVLRAQKYSRRYKYFFKTDISKFYDSIDHNVLKRALLKKIPRGKVKKSAGSNHRPPCPRSTPRMRLAYRKFNQSVVCELLSG
jgi:retron-type reverse transcriptase